MSHRHATFKDLVECSDKLVSTVYHDKFSWDARDWREFEPGFETCPVYANEMDPSLDGFVAGFAVRFTGKAIKKRKEPDDKGRLFDLVNKPKHLKRIFVTRGEAVAAAKESIDQTEERYAELTAKPHVDPNLGDPVDRASVDGAWMQAAFTGDPKAMAHYNQLRAKLPAQPLPTE